MEPPNNPRGIPSKVSAQDIVQLLSYLPGKASARGQITPESKSFTSGAFAHGGGVAGLRQNTDLQPSAYRKGYWFTVIRIPSTNQDPKMQYCPSRSSAVAKSGGSTPCPDGVQSQNGHLLPWPAVFNPKMMHCAADSPDAKHRVVLIGFTPRNFHLLDPDTKITSSEVGFPI